MFNQCSIVYECNLKNMLKCKYYKRDSNVKEMFQSCLYLYGCIHCTNINAIIESLREELIDYND